MKIELCMGSACFASGNEKVLEYLEARLEKNPDIVVELSACPCKDNCSDGPIATIDGNLVTGLSVEKIKEIIENRDNS